MTPAYPELVIFDCDGVLVDSEPISIRVLVDLIASAGHAMDEGAAYAAFLGRSMASVSELLAQHGLTVTEQHLDRMRSDLYDRFRRELKPVQGVAEAILALECPRCVASSSSPERIRLSLQLTGLIDLVEPNLFSASMVARGKPEPDLFLHAARAMGVEPSRCLVIEDSPAGIAAAKAAGMRVFGFTGGSHAGAAGLATALAAAGPELIFDDMLDLPGLVKGAAARPARYLCAVDVGTGSARAGIIDRSGRLLGRAEHPIVMHQPKPDHAEHESEDIWRAVCRAVQGALRKAEVDPAAVAGISFDATCSLVVRDADGRPLSVSTTGERRWDTIVWLDHRALGEADECTASGHRVLDFVGGVMSPEMQTPKLMWLKRNLPETWERAAHFFDLADFLTWKASGSTARSQNTLTAKWTYLGHEDGWRRDFFDGLGVGDLVERGGLPDQASPVGADLGPLTPEAARALGLTDTCRVGVGVIDAYAGALGVLGGFALDRSGIDRHLALIAGTSSCVMAMSLEPRPFAGVWGPYFGVAFPDCWLSEGGQSATGALLDHVIRWHGAGGDPDAATHQRIAARIMALRGAEGLDLAGRLHVLPDFHGNRSPNADPHAVGVISGLTLDASFDSLCRLYWRTCVAIALGVRHILDALNAQGYVIDTLHVTGGHTRNPLLMELYADATGCAVVEPDPATDAVLLGTAMVAAAAAGLHPDLRSACAAMSQGGRTRQPNPSARARFDHDYRVFLEMHRQRQALDAMS
ncbi:MAG: FGGY family pentulose kinase [Rhizobiaceae bacterium]|nr:FGGY family pentulose kinase [Rhizobiaceae bacterium]